MLRGVGAGMASVDHVPATAQVVLGEGASLAISFLDVKQV